MTTPTALSILSAIVAFHALVLVLLVGALLAALRDIAAAIRERAPDLHVQLRDVPPGPGPGARTP